MEDDTNENREKVKMKKKSEVKIEQLKVIRTIGTGTNNISPKPLKSVEIHGYNNSKQMWSIFVNYYEIAE